MPRAWRLIDSGARDAAYNMALDEAIARGTAEAGAEPTLRFFAWSVPSVTLGCFQKADQVEADYCAARSIPVVRRPTGGRAILHGLELTYSFSASAAEGRFSAGLFESYGSLGRAFHRAFLSVGLPAVMHESRRAEGDHKRSALCFRSTSYGEITVHGRKVIGSAQRRWPTAMLQQGSVPLTLDRAEMARVFKGAEGETGTLLALREVIADLGLENLKQAVATAFEDVFQVSLRPEAPTAAEEDRAEALVIQKYAHPSWTLRR